MDNTTFNKIYPFPNFMPKWMAIVVLILIACFLFFSLFTTFLEL